MNTPNTKSTTPAAPPATNVDYLPAERPAPPALPPRFAAFPVDLLPSAAAGIVRAGVESVGCDPCYLALPALAALGGAIGNTRHAVVKTGWTEPAIIWAMLVGPSGTAKTPAARIVLGPLHARHAKLIAANEQAAKEHADAMKCYEAELLKWKRKPDGDPPAEPQPPAFERALIEDTTIEALAPILRANPRGVLLHRDELAGWIGGLDRYAQNGGGDVARWLSIFNGEPITVDRRTTGTTYVACPAVSIIGGIQPDRLPVVFTRTHRDSGLLARVLIAYPAPKPKLFNPGDLPADAVDAWQRQQNYLSTLDMDADEEGKPKPRFIGMNGEAKAAFGKWADAHNARTLGLPGEVASTRSKLEGYAVRFALIFAVCDLSATITVAHIHRGCDLADWFAAEAERIHLVFGQSDADRDLAQLIDMIAARGGQITVRDLQRAKPAKYKSADVAEAALRALVEAGFACWHTPPHDGPGRPPARVARLIDESTVDTIQPNARENGNSVNRQSVDYHAATDAA